MLLREFCAENMEHVPAAVAAGAARIELCDNLAVGGTSPSYGVIKAAVAFARDAHVDVMAMARPRGGNFVYSDAERLMMIDDIAMARGLGVTGVVFGCVRPASDGKLAIDRELTAELVRAAKEPYTDLLGAGHESLAQGRGPASAVDPVAVTFHMAFDELSEKRQLEAIDVLAELGVERILTHGGPAGTPIMGNVARLRELVRYADARITILPGGGITYENAEEVAAALGVNEVHGTKIVRLG